MPLMIKLNRNIMKVYLCLDNGHFITVERYQHSTYYVFLDQEERHVYDENDSTIAICGGGFPLFIKDELRGCVIVSGLAHDEDHQLIINTLRGYKNESFCE